MKYTFLSKRQVGNISPMIYGHFIEHFHRQIYGGVYDPGNPLSDNDGLRIDVIEAMQKIKLPMLRWPGGCFVSSYYKGRKAHSLRCGMDSPYIIY